ncbi:hypothetical protein ABW19_dt0206898 [Dactylella cylindrospora]|nr:hypothetical protein ABW19_dt0206898 [Dactylella cylindrospora]
MEPGALYFLMQLEQEQLEDSTKLDGSDGKNEGLRISVPLMNWQRPVPAWIIGEDLADKLQEIMGGQVMTRWEYRKSLDIAGLQWGIADPNVAEARLHETIIPQTEKDLHNLFGPLLIDSLVDEEIGDAESIPEYSLNAGPEPEEGELTVAKFEPKMDLDSLVERRKQKREDKMPLHRSTGALSLDRAASLSSFLSLQNRIPLEIVQSSATIPDKHPSLLAPPLSDPSVTHPSSVRSGTPGPKELIEAAPPPDPKSAFVVSTRFLSRHTLYRSVKALCPSSTFIERDFDAVPERLALKEETFTPEPLLEADILITPLAGLVTTSLQAIRQKSLPRDLEPRPKDSSEWNIRDRIARLAERYEELVVGVIVDFGGSAVCSAVGLSRMDSMVIAGFRGFCTALGNVRVSVIRDSGTGKEVSRWVVKILGVYTERWRKFRIEVRVFEASSAYQWETFLRRAGLNSYAAQAVVGKIKEADCRLVDFLAMNREDRRSIFEHLIGRNVLARLEELIEKRWDE